MVNDLVDKEQMRAMVGATFSEARWEQIAKGRDKIMKSELMDAVRTRHVPRGFLNVCSLVITYANITRANAVPNQRAHRR